MVYSHITNWDTKSINLQSTYSTNWKESNYWKRKQHTTNELEQSTGALISSLKNVFSMLGQNMDFSTFFDEIQKSKYYAELLKEYIFEDVRINEFPDKPSRKTCMFLLPQEVDALEYGQMLKYDMSNMTVLKIEVLENSKVHYADLKLLDCNAASHIEKIDFARQYWIGTKNNDFNTEILFFGDFKVRQMVEKSLKVK